ncbi:MAG: hypothetical protein RMY28_037930 [Nostoc sp. ChiSLP01]|nr:hypothetical protein [Nostoc sp. CmiSLP01]MDZ8284574.1 hypothetical protein [Nostoc sp. ChiSLP01]
MAGINPVANVRRTRDNFGWFNDLGDRIYPRLLSRFPFSALRHQQPYLWRSAWQALASTREAQIYRGNIPQMCGGLNGTVCDGFANVKDERAVLPKRYPPQKTLPQLCAPSASVRLESD